MKITYERLNQIIEEEVFKFKKLNEQTTPINTPVDTVTLDKLTKLFNDARGFASSSKENASAVIKALTPFESK